jgi:hypothetical protein
MDLPSSKIDSPVYRSSYASSSTNSHSLSPDAQFYGHVKFPSSLSRKQKTTFEVCIRFFSAVWNEIHRLPNRRSIGSMQVKLPDDLSRQTSFMSSISKSSSSGKPQPVSDEPPVRPKLRSRGMTVGALPQKSGFFVKEQTTQRKLSQASAPPNITSVKPLESPSKTLLAVRQPSLSSSRLCAPPTAPPTVSLPTPPQTIPQQPDFRQRKGLNSHPSPSSSSLVTDHITSLSPIPDDSQASNQNLPVDDCSFCETVEPSPKSAPPPRTLKKLPSQRSLRPASSPSSSMSSKTTIPDSSENRKHRNSQQCRLPMPTLSLSIRTSFVSSQPRNGDPTPPYSTAEQRKSRKRLFSSGSQRPSISSRILAREDDTSSVSSVRSDIDTIHTPYTPWAVTRNYPKSSSFWEEGSDTTPSSPAAPSVDYQPQAIMSRDDLAKLEASISNAAQETASRSTFSFPPSNGPEVFEQEPSRVVLSSMMPERSSEWSGDATVASLTPRSRSARRPLTADPLVRDSSREAEIGSAESRRRVATVAPRLDTIPDSTSLPPPPRRRILSSNSVRSTASTSTTSTLVPAPVERLNYSKIKLLDRSNTVITTTTPLQSSARGAGSLLTTTPPPATRSIAISRGKVRPSGVLEKAIHRRSIMRKPSFLEIDGETDPESEPEVTEKRDSLFLNMKPPSATTVANGSGKTGESFLDLARESFDTIRS